MQQEEFTRKPKEGGVWDVAIIGSGPSAFAAGIYTTRGAASTLILGGVNWGGQLMLTTEVDNFPGFPEGIQGPDLMNAMRAQVERFGAEFHTDDVESVKFGANGTHELTAGGKTYKARSVIIATGAETKWLGVPGEDRLRGRGVSSCAPCDAPFFKDKKVMVVGGGDAAMEEALVLTKYSPEVTIVHRRDAFRASEAMQKKILDSGKIKVIWNTEVVELKGESMLESVVLKNNETGQTQEMSTEGLFVAIGHVPSTGIFKGVVELDEKGYVKPQDVDGAISGTSVRGVFVAGDVHDYHYRQAITAAGFGCMAGMDTLKFLDKQSPSW